MHTWMTPTSYNRVSPINRSIIAIKPQRKQRPSPAPNQKNGAFLFNGRPLVLLDDHCPLCYHASKSPNTSNASTTTTAMATIICTTKPNQSSSYISVDPNQWQSRTLCCGRIICHSCDLRHRKQDQFQSDPSKRCPLCHSAPITQPTEIFNRLMVYANTYNEPTAQVRIGNCYLYGSGVDASYPRALEWFDRASVQGIPESFYKLGVLYENGWGTRKSFKRAYKYYTLALESGVEEAYTRISALKKHARRR